MSDYSPHSDRVRQALAFLESVIKSGEGYTETVVLETSEALTALAELQGERDDFKVGMLAARDEGVAAYNGLFEQLEAAEEHVRQADEDRDHVHARYLRLEEQNQVLVGRVAAGEIAMDRVESLEEQLEAHQRLIDQAALLLHNSMPPRHERWHDDFDRWLADVRASFPASEPKGDDSSPQPTEET